MWTLKQAHRVGELTAAVAVVISLIFVGIEVAQNNQINIENFTQRTLSEQRHVIRTLADNADFACIYSRASQNYGQLSGSDRLRYSAYVLSLFMTFEEMQMLMQRGRIEPGIWQAQDRLITEIIQLPGNQQWFATRRNWFSDGFQEYLDGLVGKIPMKDVVVYEDPVCISTGGN
jgi:hypothetical protein